MNTLQASFEDVADWCEKHLNGPARENGTTMGAVLRIYGQLAALPPCSDSEGHYAEWKALTRKAERLLKVLSNQSIEPLAWDNQRQDATEPASMRVNMIYDSSPH